MRKYGFIAVIAIILLLIPAYIYVNGIISNYNMNKDRIEYPLEKIEIDDNSRYILVKTEHTLEGTKREVIDDTGILKENKDKMYVSNNGSIYGTTANGFFTLYKDGISIGMADFDNVFSYGINYGSLENAFRKVNELELMELLYNKKIYEDEICTVMQNSENNYYYTFIRYQNDVKEVELTKQPLNIKYLSDNLIEFKNTELHSSRFYDIENENLSAWYNGVKAVNGRTIIFTNGTDIVISEVFKTTFKKIFEFDPLNGSVNKLEAEFITDNVVKLKFTDNNGIFIEKEINLGELQW